MTKTAAGRRADRRALAEVLDLQRGPGSKPVWIYDRARKAQFGR